MKGEADNEAHAKAGDVINTRRFGEVCIDKVFTCKKKQQKPVTTLTLKQA
jgi:hypothetical protein